MAKTNKKTNKKQQQKQTKNCMSRLSLYHNSARQTLTDKQMDA